MAGDEQTPQPPNVNVVQGSGTSAHTVHGGIHNTNNYYGDGRPRGAAGEASAAARDPASLSNLPPLSRNLVARPELTKRIHAALSAEGNTGALRSAAASAHGGYGKTVAALLYAYEYAAAYPGGRFFLSLDGADFPAQLALLGPYFGVPDEAKVDVAAAMVARALRDGEPALLILDNVNDDAHWKKIVGSNVLPGGACRVLVTTRAERVGQATPIRVSRLSKEEARELYAKFCRAATDAGADGREPPDDATADAITEWLEGLAVAVAAVAARMMLRPELKWADYAERLRNLTVEQLPDANPTVRAELGADARGLEEHRRTLRVIDDAIDALPSAERRAAEYAALLPPDLVPTSWLEHLLAMDAAHGTGFLKLVADAPADIGDCWNVDAVNHLRTLGLLRPAGPEASVMALHRLYRQRLLHRIGLNPDQLRWLAGSLGHCANARREAITGGSIDNPRILTDPTLRWELQPLASLCQVLWGNGALTHAAQLASWMAPMLNHLGRFHEARRCLEPIVVCDPVIKAVLGDEWRAVCYHHLGSTMKHLKEFGLARQHMEKGREINQELYGGDDYRTALAEANLALVLTDIGEYTQAREKVERALRVWRHSTHDTRAYQASGNCNLAIILQRSGDIPGARARIEDAVNMFELLYGAKHPTFATALHNMASIMFDARAFEDAVSLESRALGILAENFDEDHPRIGIAKAALANYQAAANAAPRDSAGGGELTGHG